VSQHSLSIGLPVFNGAAYIDAALTSLRTQTRGDFELIVSDNASTDETPRIIAEHAARDPRLRVIRQSKNLGAIGNFIAVLNAAQAAHFMWAAADDTWSPDWVETLLPVAQSRRCMAFGRVQMTEVDGQPRAHAVNGRNLSFTGPAALRRLRYFVQPAFMGKANPFYSIFPRDLLTDDALAPFRRGGRGADMLTLYHLLRQTELVSVKGPYIYKRHHQASAAMTETTRMRFRRTQLPDYLTLSSPIEQAALIAAFPVAATLIPLRRIASRMTRR
jgi:glycosyltransferase involved in cell wall biosynthesis